MKWITGLLASVTLCGCTTVNPLTQKHKIDIGQTGVDMVLDGWHMSASNGLFDLYFDSMTDDAIFLGTDETERWNKEQFMGYAREPFSDGHGWTYTPRDRFVRFADDRKTAWVDEVLDHDKYGVLRGTGVLELHGEDWKIAHYSLTFLVPNDKASAVVEAIKGGADSAITKD